MTTQVDLACVLEELSEHHPLSDAHRDSLLSGGIDTGDYVGKAVIGLRGYATITASTPRDATVYGLLKDVAGFSRANLDHCARSGGDTLVIPSFDIDGTPVAFELRADVPRVGQDGKERKYLRCSGEGTSRMDFGPSDLRAFGASVTDGIDRPIVFTEGIKKGDALRARGVACIVLPGVGQWDPVELREVPWKGRDTYVCFDADDKVNPGVALQRDRLSQHLVNKGANVKIIDLPGRVGDVACKGLDDHFAAGWSIVELFACAKDIDQVRPAREVAKLKRDVEAMASSEEVRDARLADLVADECFAGKWVHTDEAGWLQWDGTRWRERGSDDDRVTNDAKEFLKTWFDAKVSAIDWSNANAAKDLTNYQRVLDAYAIGQACRLARGNPNVKRDLTDFDADPEVINTPSGLLDLRTGAVTAHDSSMCVTKITKVGYVPGARHPAWDKALTALPSDEVRDWFQIRMGEMMFGRVPADSTLLFLIGSGSNGKGSLLESVESVMGDYAIRGHSNILLSDKGTPTEFMQLKGARLAFFDELPLDGYLNDVLMKKVTGPRITARPLFKQEVTFDSTHMVIVTANDAPKIVATDGGTWRRPMKVPLPYKFSSPTVAYDPSNPCHRIGDPEIKPTLMCDTGAREAVMAWLIEGAMRWARDFDTPGSRQHIPVPEAVRAENEQWRASGDPSKLFMDTIMVADPDGKVLSTDLLSEYNAFLASLGSNRVNARTLRTRVTSEYALTNYPLGIESGKSVKVSDPSRISRPLASVAVALGPFTNGPADVRVDNGLKPGVHQCYTGMRFRTDADNAADAFGVDAVEAAELITASAAATGAIEDPFLPIDDRDQDDQEASDMARSTTCVEEGCTASGFEGRDRCDAHVPWCTNEYPKCFGVSAAYPAPGPCDHHAPDDDETWCTVEDCDDDAYVPSVSPLCRTHLQEAAEDAYGEDFETYLRDSTPLRMAEQRARELGDGDVAAARAALARWWADAATRSVA